MAANRSGLTVITQNWEHRKNCCLHG